jgi:hypothetical protein
MAVRPLLAVSALALLLLAGCSADPLNVVVLNARAPGDKCDFKDATLYVERGTVDFTVWQDASGNFGQARSYFQAFSWENQMQPTEIQVNGATVDPGGGNDFIGDTIVYEYQYTDPNVALAPETQNVRAVIAAGGNPTDNYMGADLIQPQAAAALDNTLTPTGQTLLTTFQVFGKTAGGTSKHTNKVSFPLTVYKTSTTTVSCVSPMVLFSTSCGIPGRDAPVHCIKGQ